VKLERRIKTQKVFLIEEAQGFKHMAEIWRLNTACSVPLVGFLSIFFLHRK